MLMDIIDWKLLSPVAVVILTFTCTWSFKLWYTYIKEKQNEVCKKIEIEIEETIGVSKKLKREIGAERFANRLLNLTEMKKGITEGKNLFEETMIYTALLILFSIGTFSIFSSIQSPEIILKYQSLLIILLSIFLFFHLNAFFKIRKIKASVEEYLDGVSVEEIYKE